MQNAEVQLTSAVKSMTNMLNFNIANSENKVKYIANNMANIFNVKCIEGEHKLNKIMARIDANNPVRILGQGYSKLYGTNGLATDIERVAVGDEITVLTNGGKIGAEVKSITKIN